VEDAQVIHLPAFDHFELSTLFHCANCSATTKIA